MLNLLIDDFMVELKDGAIKNVGPSNKTASAKLFDVESAEAREFGDKRVKLVCEDDEGNEVQVALFPEQVRKVARDIEALEDDSPVFEQV
jgi:L-asparaginase II